MYQVVVGSETDLSGREAAAAVVAVAKEDPGVTTGATTRKHAESCPLLMYTVSTFSEKKFSLERQQGTELSSATIAYR